MQNIKCEKITEELDTYWHITDVCSLDCEYCFRPRFTSRVPKVGEIPYALSLLGVKHVTITGGEPTEHIQLKEELIALCKLGIRASIISNGTHVEILKPLLEQNLLDTICISIHSHDSKCTIRRLSKLLADFDVIFLVPINTFSSTDTVNELTYLKKICYELADRHSVCPLAIEWQGNKSKLDVAVLRTALDTTSRFDSDIFIAQMNYFHSNKNRTDNCRFLSRTLYVSPDGSLLRCFYRAKQHLGSIFQPPSIDTIFSQPKCRCISSGCTCVNQGNLVLF